jgi:hypothetical protein
MPEYKKITIADEGKILQLNYSGLLEYHGGSAVFGATVGFRALQVAGQELSSSEIWDRKNITVQSEHPGPGVRDAIEFVTRCVTRGGFQASTRTECNSGMKFVWTVTVEKQSVTVRLRDGFLPQRFFELLNLINNDSENPAYRNEFDALKLQLSQSLWNQPLNELFEINFLENLNHA